MDPEPQRPADLLYPERREAILADLCVACEKPARFYDAVSEREYKISGLCQNCQETVFEA